MYVADMDAHVGKCVCVCVCVSVCALWQQMKQKYPLNTHTHPPA